MSYVCFKVIEPLRIGIVAHNLRIKNSDRGYLAIHNFFSRYVTTSATVIYDINHQPFGSRWQPCDQYHIT